VIQHHFQICCHIIDPSHTRSSFTSSYKQSSFHHLYWHLSLFHSLSFLSALHPCVSLGFLKNQSPSLSLYFIFSIHCFIFITFRSAATSSINLIRVLPLLLPTNNLPSTIFIGISLPLPFSLHIPAILFFELLQVSQYPPSLWIYPLLHYF